MSKTVSSTDAKSHFGSLLGWTEETGDPVIIEKRGKPVAVIVPYKAFEEMREQQDRLRRKEAWEKLRRLREELAERNSDLTQEEADKIADRAVRDTIDAMVDKGMIRFEE
jgi:prevent-host-death family protein